MKAILMSLLVSGASTWVTTSVAFAQDDGKDCKIRIIVDGDGEWVEGEGNIFVVKAEALGDADGKMKWVTKVGKGDGRSFTGGEHKVLLRRFGGNDAGGWLGVSIGSLSAALADQLDLDDEGILIKNVVEGSPADKGGIKVNDVILSINGEALTGDVGSAIALVKQNKPGDEIDIVVLRNGRESELTITLGSRSGSGGNFLWKFEGAPDVEFEDRIRTFGRMLHRGDDGAWSVEDLGDLELLK